ncbi:hypothetical protein [Leptolyngbya sp. AN03gr2]|uniref:hypothetical protein n=1 Tax=Leptolyngbya sp. AN03gr2 TaxID=3423364 RepID=UPI003D31E993
MKEDYIAYRIAAWKFVNWTIAQAEIAHQVWLDASTRRVAKGYVINWVIEITQLPVDLVPSTLSPQECHTALNRLQQLKALYRSQ